MSTIIFTTFFHLTFPPSHIAFFLGLSILCKFEEILNLLVETQFLNFAEGTKFWRSQLGNLSCRSGWKVTWTDSFHKSHKIAEWLQCTMAQAGKRGIQGLQKMPKSKPLLQCYFWSNFDQTFFGWCKMTQFFCQIFVFVKKIKYWVYFFHLSVKHSEGLVRPLWNLHHVCFMSFTKKSKKHKNGPGSPSLWK